MSPHTRFLSCILSKPNRKFTRFLVELCLLCVQLNVVLYIVQSKNTIQAWYHGDGLEIFVCRSTKCRMGMPGNFLSHQLIIGDNVRSCNLSCRGKSHEFRHAIIA